MNIVRTGLLAAALLVPTVAYADNDCEALKPLLDQNPVIISYDPFDAANTMHGFNLQVRTQNCPESRNVFLQLGSDDPSVTNGHIITATGPGGVTIQATVTDRQSNNGGGQDDTFNLKVGTDTLYFFLDRGQVVPPGDYRAPLLAEERLDNGNNPQGDNVITPFDLIITVGPAVGLARRSERGSTLASCRPTTLPSRRCNSMPMPMLAMSSTSHPIMISSCFAAARRGTLRSLIRRYWIRLRCPFPIRAGTSTGRSAPTAGAATASTLKCRRSPESRRANIRTC